MSDLAILFRIIRANLGRTAIFLALAVPALVALELVLGNTSPGAYGGAAVVSCSLAPTSRLVRLCDVLPLRRQNVVLGVFLAGLAGMSAVLALYLGLHAVLAAAGHPSPPLTKDVFALSVGLSVFACLCPLVSRLGVKRAFLLLALLLLPGIAAAPVALHVIAMAIATVLGTGALVYVVDSWFPWECLTLGVIAIAVSLPLTISVFERQDH